MERTKLETWIEARQWKETKALGLYPGGNEEIMKIFNIYRTIKFVNEKLIKIK